MKVLVTGGAGFIGHHLVKALLLQGHEVVVLDNFSTGLIANLEKVKGDIEIQTGTVLNALKVFQLVRRVDLVYHLAADVSVAASVDQPFETTMTTFMGTMHVMEACMEYNKKIVFPSSAAVYGAREGVCSEAHAPAPISPYGAAKLSCEAMAEALRISRRLDYAALRLFNVFGPGQRADSPYSGVVSLFAEAVAGLNPVTVFGSGKQTRDFVPVDFVVSCLRKAQHWNGVTNVGTGHGTSLLDLVQAMGDIVDRPVLCQHSAERAGDIFSSVASVERLKPLTGFLPGHEAFITTLCEVLGQH